MIFFLSLSSGLLSPERRKLNSQRDSDRYSIYTKLSAANGHVHPVFPRLAALDLTRTGKVFLYQESRPPRYTRTRPFHVTDNNNDDDTLDILRWGFQKFKDLACSAILRLNFCTEDAIFSRRQRCSEFFSGSRPRLIVREPSERSINILQAYSVTFWCMRYNYKACITKLVTVLKKYITTRALKCYGMALLDVWTLRRIKMLYIFKETIEPSIILLKILKRLRHQSIFCS